MKNLLDRMKEAADKKGGGGSRNEFLQLKDKEQVRVRFLQELAEDSPSFNTELGLASAVAVHKHPANFKRQALCTAGDDSANPKPCWACEQTANNKRWFPKNRFYINVLVKSPEGNKVKVLNQGFTDKHIVLNLIEFAEEYGSITDRDYKIKRTGSDMNNTSYTITPLEKSEMPDLTGLELSDLEKVVRVVPYEEQEAYYNGEAEQAETDSNGW